MKIKKLYLRITLFVVIATAVAILTLSIIASSQILGIMKNNAETSLNNTVNSTMDVMNQFVKTQNAYLDSYLETDAIRALIETLGEDPQALAAAQAQTESFATVVPNLDSVLYTDYEGTCVVHNQPEMVGYRNDDETIAMLQGVYFNPEAKPVSGTVTIASPATGQVSFCTVKSQYNSAGVPSGYATFTITCDELNSILGAIKVTDIQDTYLINVSDSTIIYATDTSLITTKYESGPLLDLLTKVAEGSLTSGTINYTSELSGAQMLGSYLYNPSLGWLLVIGADRSDLYNEAQSAQRSIVLIGILVLVIISVILAVLIKQMVSPITTVQRTLTRVAHHDLHPADEVRGYLQRSDEIGELSRSTTDVVNMFSEVVDVLKNCSDSLNDSTINLDATSKQLVSVTNENASVADRLSGSIERTGASLANVNEEINKIVSYANMVTEKVDSGMRQSDEIIRSATETNSKIDDVIQTNSASLDETMENMQAALESLNAVEKINELADAIMDITSQTNLLSLNASIEAARAGESGRGFAVVAGEIGQLANQSRDTAMNIQSIVDESNRSVVNVREQVSKLMDYIKSELLGSFGLFEDQSKQYDAGISEIREAVASIGEAMDDLNRSVNEIAREISEINNASSTNNTGVSEIVDKNEETSNVTKDIEQLAASSRENADNLVNVVNQFHI